MGDVWLAEQTHPVHRQVALKVIKAGMDTAQVVARFEAERQALALMSHPAIAQVFDAGATPQGRPFFAMEYVHGEAITSYCNRHRLTTRQRINLFLEVCDGVQHAHQKGIIHRDLKPSNILVTLQDDHPVPKIIDFGVAKATTQHLTERTLYTELGVLIGTPEYMSPEQAEMTGLDIDTRTDVYALGVILYELLAGVLPFDGKSLREKSLDEIRRTIRETDPARPSTRLTSLGLEAAAVAETRRTDPTRLSNQLRGDLDSITMKALEKDRTRRYGSASDLAADLRRHLEHVPVLASPPSTLYRVKKFVRRHHAGVAAAAALVVLLVAFATTMAVQASRIARERDRANSEAEAAKHVSDFLVGLFKISDPSETLGNTLTAREVLDKGAQQIEKTLVGQPAVQARLEVTIGTVYTSLGMYRAAEPLLLHAVTTVRRSPGPNDPETLIALNALANLYWYSGRYPEAEPLYAEIVNARRRVLGEQHPDTLRAQFDLASTYSREERWEETERLYLHILEAQRRVLGEEHFDTIQTLGNVASLYWRMGRYAQSLPLATRAAALQRRVSGPDHPRTFEQMHNVATTYDRLQQYDEAESMYRQTIDGKGRVLGVAHPSSVLTVLRYAQMLQTQRRYSDAEEQLLAIERTLERGPATDRQNEASIVQQLVSLYGAWSKPERASEWRAKLLKEPATKDAAR